MPSAQQELSYVLHSSDLYKKSKELATYVVNKSLGRRQKRDRIGEKLYELCSEMRNERESFFSNTCNRLNLNRDNIEESSKTVMTDVFSDGCNFGRIVALFTFCTTLCQYCSESIALEDQIDMVIENTALAIFRQRQWFEEQGSWDGFINYFTTPEEKIWKGFVITTVGLGAVASLLYVNS